MAFEWDDDKAAVNLRKHGVSFAEAATVFDDPGFVFAYDEKHTVEEDRYRAVGISSSGRLISVIHCYRDRDTVTRIISARKASKSEVSAYAKDKT